MNPSPSPFSDLLDANRRFVAGFGAEHRDAEKVPTRQLVILTCMDARVEPWPALGVSAGEAHTLRNAGGRVSEDVIRSIAASVAALGTERVAVIHHTDCGMKGDDETVRSALRDRGGDVGDDFRFLTFSDDEDAVREDVRILRASPIVPSDVAVEGFLYDVGSGELRPVETD